MAPSDDDDKNPAGVRIAHKEGNTATPADDSNGETPTARSVHIAESTTIVHWEGPLPPPALLEQYDQIVPGLASRIVEQAQSSDSHVRQLEEIALTAAIRYSTRGQWMGFTAVLAILGVSAFAIVMGAWWVAGIALSVVAGTAARFVLGTLGKKGKKRQEK